MRSSIVAQAGGQELSQPPSSYCLPSILGSRDLRSRKILANPTTSLRVLVVVHPMRFLQPDATRWNFFAGSKAQRHVLREPIPMLFLNIGIEEHDFKSGTISQHGSNSVHFVPRASCAKPSFRVFERIKNIVDMDVDAGLEARKDGEHIVVNVAAGFQHVGAVNEKYIARLELFEIGSRDFLQTL